MKTEESGNEDYSQKNEIRKSSLPIQSQLVTKEQTFTEVLP